MEMMMRTIKMERAVNNNEWIENEEKAAVSKLPEFPLFVSIDIHS